MCIYIYIYIYIYIHAYIYIYIYIYGVWSAALQPGLAAEDPARSRLRVLLTSSTYDLPLALLPFACCPLSTTCYPLPLWLKHVAGGRGPVPKCLRLPCPTVPRGLPAGGGIQPRDVSPLLDCAIEKYDVCHDAVLSFAKVCTEARTFYSKARLG